MQLYHHGLTVQITNSESTKLMRKYRQLTTELTFRCNAKCPACHRVKPLRINLNDKKYTISLGKFKELFYPELLKNLRVVSY